MAFDPASIAATRVMRVVGRPASASPVLHRQAVNPVEAAPVTGCHAVAEVHGGGRDHEVVRAEWSAGTGQVGPKGRVHLGDFKIEGDHGQRLHPEPGEFSRSYTVGTTYTVKAMEHFRRGNGGNGHQSVLPTRIREHAFFRKQAVLRGDQDARV